MCEKCLPYSLSLDYSELEELSYCLHQLVYLDLHNKLADYFDGTLPNKVASRHITSLLNIVESVDYILDSNNTDNGN